MIYSCCTESRKEALAGNPILNGIDFLEVLDHDAVPLDSPRQQTILVHCLKVAPSGLTPANVLIAGGESITGITAQWISPASGPLLDASVKEREYFGGLADPTRTLVIRTSKAGDFAPYLLRLVNNYVHASEDEFRLTEVLSGFDPQLAEVSFSFKVECGPDFDCAPDLCECANPSSAPPPINYLAKDYGSFRSTILDRMNQVLPNWGASSEADLGIALAELIAYVGDYLSYQQDAVATEAYLQTARSRISLRRHALLVDYHVRDGCNARAWIAVQVANQMRLDRTLMRFYTFAPGMPPNLMVGSQSEAAALLAGVVVFEPMYDASLYPEHNTLYFHTWGEANCCLPAGATEATLAGSLQRLQIGDVLVFEEILGPQTGNPADADLRHRHAVRLTNVAITDAQGQTLVDPLFEEGTGKPITSVMQKPTAVTQIRWSVEDALPFPLCISSTYVDSDQKQQLLTNVSVAFGNVVLADHGLSFSDIPLPKVPYAKFFAAPALGNDHCQPSTRVPLPVRYRPQLSDNPLAQVVPLQVAELPVTTGIVRLQLTQPVGIAGANGTTSLLVSAKQPLVWPQYIGVRATPNGAHPGDFDLEVVYNPPGAASVITLESLRNLSLQLRTFNYVVKQVNSLSQFISIPSGYIPLAIAPVTFPSTPAMLSNAGPTDLKDQDGNTYLTVQATNPSLWPSLFGVMTREASQDAFDLVVVFSPILGGNGVQVPIILEQFNGIAVGYAEQIVGAGSKLITVKSFANQPGPDVSAFSLTHYDAQRAVPALTLASTSDDAVTSWTPKPDLMASSSVDQNFVVEINSEGAAYLRFGDDTNGRRPLSGTSFFASYRVGNGIQGNVGADTLINFASNPLITACTNPLPAFGGVAPETNEQIRRRAPQAFMTQERAVTMADYERVATMSSQVKDAVAALRWTGSWYTVFVTAEPRAGGTLSTPLGEAVEGNLNRYRLAGQDIQLQQPQYLSLQVELMVCVDPAYIQSDVEQSVRQVLGNKVLANGRKGLFYPGNFAFGQSVYLSPIYAAARSVPGVGSVSATLFAPQGDTTNVYLHRGEITLGPFQIARLENDPSFPNHGQLRLIMQGGR